MFDNANFAKRAMAPGSDSTRRTGSGMVGFKGFEPQSLSEVNPEKLRGEAATKDPSGSRVCLKFTR